MKIKIKVYAVKYGCMPHIITKGDWVDLINCENVRILKGEAVKVSLGVAMQLPRGFEAIVAPRSSTYNKFKVEQVNSIGVIDNSYCSQEDIWKVNFKASRDTFIPEGVRIAQFRIQLSQKANIWNKLKWLLSNGIKLVQVESLSAETRGGFGSTGDKGYVDKKNTEKK